MRRPLRGTSRTTTSLGFLANHARVMRHFSRVADNGYFSIARDYHFVKPQCGTEGRGVPAPRPFRFPRLGLEPRPFNRSGFKRFVEPTAGGLISAGFTIAGRVVRVRHVYH